MPNPQAVLSNLEEIETEMRRINLWQEKPLQPEQYDFRAAFAGDTMSFPQWLQFIFIPSVKRAAANEDFPSKSQVSAKAVREFDGMEAASGLIELLSRFDALF
ncbi:MAG TPA: YqcC family protein [Anaerolineales bacterium]|nr:YqcC family protein [Anaerolineales bacterium]